MAVTYSIALTVILLSSIPIGSMAGSWFDIISSYLTNSTATTTTAQSTAFNNPLPFNEALWIWNAAWESKEQEEVSLEIVQRIIGCPIAHEFGISKHNPYGYNRIPTEQNEWRPMYEAYHAVVPQEEATIPSTYQNSAFVLPIDIEYSPESGRGIVAAAFIPKGTMVWRPRNAAEFTSAKQVRQFLEHLLSNSDKIVACDAIRWLYSMKASPKDDHYVLCIDFDEGSMINRGMVTDDVNVEQVFDKIDGDDRAVYGCQHGELFAARDIHPGEEILMNYDEFAEGEGFWVHGLDPDGL
ncbi:MAG: hypothetical protein SGILL_004999 [Bacillariaceae sp.]